MVGPFEIVDELSIDQLDNYDALFEEEDEDDEDFEEETTASEDN